MFGGFSWIQLCQYETLNFYLLFFFAFWNLLFLICCFFCHFLLLVYFFYFSAPTRLWGNAEYSSWHCIAQFCVCGLICIQLDCHFSVYVWVSSSQNHIMWYFKKGLMAILDIYLCLHYCEFAFVYALKWRLYIVWMWNFGYYFWGVGLYIEGLVA